jgi:hypothetical protein
VWVNGDVLNTIYFFPCQLGWGVVLSFGSCRGTCRLLGAYSGEKGRGGRYIFPQGRIQQTAGDVHRTTIERAHHREENQTMMKMVQIDYESLATWTPYQQGRLIDVTDPSSIHPVKGQGEEGKHEPVS